MKKLVILGTALLALNAVASEVQLKSGYDTYRDFKNGVGFSGAGTATGKKFNTDAKLEKGPTAGFEYIFDNQGEFEWGVGAEYKFSRKSSKFVERESGDKVKVGRSVPVYALGKFNLITTKSGNDALYLLGRVGYDFAKTTSKLNDALGGVDIKAKGGLYTAAGIGTEFGPVSVEALYERSDVKLTEKNTDLRSRSHIDTAGIRVGYRFGQLKNDRSPKVVERVVTVPAPAPAPAPVVKPDIDTRDTIQLPFSCAADERKCVIRGFKVDGRVPNEAEAADLKTISNIINQFADGGTIDFVGHTDSTGSAAYNQKLSVARAQNVARLLKEYGLKNTISYGTITGQGESNPMDTNDTTQGRYNNRRVELFFQNVDFNNVKFINR